MCFWDTILKLFTLFKIFYSFVKKYYQMLSVINVVFFSGEQAIFFTGREELFIGETAMYIAFIHPKISAISKIFWQRTDKQGCIHTIDTNDGKYTGSTTTFPSPTLYIHFVRKEDEGTYQLFVNTFRKIIQKSVSLVVKEGGKLFCFFGQCSQVIISIP